MSEDDHNGFEIPDAIAVSVICFNAIAAPRKRETSSSVSTSAVETRGSLYLSGTIREPEDSTQHQSVQEHTT